MWSTLCHHLPMTSFVAIQNNYAWDIIALYLRSDRHSISSCWQKVNYWLLGQIILDLILTHIAVRVKKKWNIFLYFSVVQLFHSFLLLLIFKRLLSTIKFFHATTHATIGGLGLIIQKKHEATIIVN